MVSPVQLSVVRVLGIMFAIFHSSLTQSQTLSFIYENHPPFTSSENGTVVGIFVVPTERAVAEAGFAISWTEQTYNRMKRDLLESKRPLCATGYAWDEYFARNNRITGAIGHFGRSGLLVRVKDKQKFHSLVSVKALFENTDFVGGFVKGAEYAVPYQRFLRKSHKNHLIVASTHEQLAQLVARGRLDFIFENELMVPVHQQMNEDEGETMAFVSLPDMPRARSAHIVCNMAMPGDWMARLNASVRKMSVSDKR